MLDDFRCEMTAKRKRGKKKRLSKCRKTGQLSGFYIFPGVLTNPAIVWIFWAGRKNFHLLKRYAAPCLVLKKLSHAGNSLLSHIALAVHYLRSAAGGGGGANDLYWLLSMVMIVIVKMKKMMMMVLSNAVMCHFWRCCHSWLLHITYHSSHLAEWVTLSNRRLSQIAVATIGTDIISISTRGVA